MKIAILMLIIIFLAWKILWYICYRFATSNRSRQVVPMKWKMVKQIYPINPDRFSYDLPTSWGEDMRVLYYNRTPIMLSFFGYQRLRYGFYKNYFQEIKEEENEALKEILKYVQRDIDNLKRKSEKESKEGKDGFLNVFTKIGEER